MKFLWKNLPSLQPFLIQIVGWMHITIVQFPNLGDKKRISYWPGAGTVWPSHNCRIEGNPHYFKGQCTGIFDPRFFSLKHPSSLFGYKF
jgi:hypothetical protein